VGVGPDIIQCKLSKRALLPMAPNRLTALLPLLLQQGVVVPRAGRLPRRVPLAL